MRVSLLTVIPSPYQRQLFSAMASEPDIDLTVFYYAASASDREWRSNPLAAHERQLKGVTIRQIGAFAHLNPGVVSAVRGARPDVTIVSDYSAPTAQIAMRYLNLARRPWIFWGEVPGFSNRGAAGLWARRQLQAPLRGAAAIAAIGRNAFDAYSALFPGKPVFNIPYFCDLEPYRQAAAQRRAEGSDRPYVDILFSGQMIERKGVDVLIEAFARIADDAPKLRLSLLGGGPEIERFKAMTPERLADRVRFLGHREPDDLPALFADADAFCLPSRHDGWGVVVNEAIGAGLPAIISDKVGAGADLVEEGVNGRRMPAGDVDALASALLDVAGDDARRSRYAAAAQSAAQKWGLDEGVRRWRDALSAVAK